ncbi:MAG TPA: AAA family ATPase [bacterium]|nr:AAA family ATPase [bacterium]HQN72983.1 AAA family ATPase [bacterium]
MRIKFKNLGALKQAEFSLGELTIICGCNNTGKTYAAYALFGFLSFWREVFSVHIEDEIVVQLLTDGAVIIDIQRYSRNAANILSEGCKEYTKQLPMVFAAPADRFKDTEFELILLPEDIETKGRFERKMRAANADLFSITKEENSNELVITLLVEKENLKIPKDAIVKIISDAIKEIIFGHLFPNPFIASAERTGAAIFRKELNFSKNRMLEEMSKSDKNINPLEILFKTFSDYALPVKTNVEFTRQLEEISKRSSFISDNHHEILNDFADIIGGKYTVTRNDELYFEPRGEKIKLTMDESSSAVRSLLDLGFYLRHAAKKSDLLIVDEPELNLHPENQRKVARLLATLVNLGVKVFITTHSDYIIKELNTLIMLKQNKPHIKRIAEREGYKESELIDSEKIKVYISEEALIKLDDGQRKTKCQTLNPADINAEYGIEAKSFDTTIDTMNRIQEEIVWGGE